MRNGSTSEFKARVAMYRNAKGLSRSALAHEVGVTSAAVGKWERGEGFPRQRHWEKLQQALGVNAIDLHLPPFNDGDE
jgi:ribosome-binding protein aMBF1 (putative translation factor)